MRIAMAAAVLSMGCGVVANAALVMPPTTQPGGAPLWMPSERLPSKPLPQQERTRLGQLLAPTPPRAPPDSMHRLDRENTGGSLAAERYCRSWLPYYQFTALWGGPHGVAVGGVESPESERDSGP